MNLSNLGIGSIGVAIVALIGFWLKWYLDSRTEGKNYRRKRIQEWREEIDRCSTFMELRETATYEQLKHRFTPSQLRGLTLTHLDINSKINPEKSKLSEFHEVVNEIEREWKLL